MKNEADKVNAKLAELRKRPHNGKIYQEDDVDYLLALAETQGCGLGAINPAWFRAQAKLIKGTLDALASAEDVAPSLLKASREFFAWYNKTHQYQPSCHPEHPWCKLGQVLHDVADNGNKEPSA